MTRSTIDLGRGIVALAALAALVSPALAAKVELLEAGAEPHAVIAYDLKQGAEQRFVLRQAQNVETILDGERTPVDVPTTVVTCTSRVVDVDSSRAALCSFEILDAQIEQEDGTLAKAPSALVLVGLDGKLVVDAQGRSRRPSEAAPSSALAMFEPGLRQLLIELPVEPIGVGATWRFQRKTNPGAMRITEEVTCHLRERSGARIGLTVWVEHKDVEQEPGASDYRYNEVSGLSEGTWEIDLRHPFPHAVSFRHEGQSEGEVKLAGTWHPITAVRQGKTEARAVEVDSARPGRHADR